MPAGKTDDILFPGGQVIYIIHIYITATHIISAAIGAGNRCDLVECCWYTDADLFDIVTDVTIVVYHIFIIIGVPGLVSENTGLGIDIRSRLGHNISQGYSIRLRHSHILALKSGIGTGDLPGSPGDELFTVNIYFPLIIRESVCPQGSRSVKYCELYAVIPFFTRESIDISIEHINVITGYKDIIGADIGPQYGRLNRPGSIIVTDGKS